MDKLSQPSKRSNRYEQNRSLNTISRMYDNHFDRDLHEKPWISLGIFKTDKMIKYEHSDAGLSFHNIKIKKLRTFQELWEKNQEIYNKSSEHQGFRQFREFQDLQEEDIIITIEYCTNCEEHKGSTKHVEEKYLQTAINLKNEILARFPICKVILKPLIYDHLDHSIDTMFIQRRLGFYIIFNFFFNLIGCFEVQCMSKQRGIVKSQVVYSKLSQKEWPEFPRIINRLPFFFKKVNFNLEFKFNGSDQILSNVEVKIQPYRPNQQLRTTSRQRNEIHSQSMRAFDKDFVKEQQQTLRPQSTNQLRPQSTTQTRPKSAYSTLSAQSQKSMKSKQVTSEQQEEYYRVEKTNKDGKIVLKDVPLDIYEIIIEETNDFMSENQKINLFDIVDKNQPLEKIVYLRKQTHSCICVQIFCEFTPISECKVELIPIKGGKEAILKETPIQSGKYEIVVEPGQFKVLIKKIGYHVQEQVITTKSGVCNYQIELKRAKQDEGYDPVADALEKKLSIKPSLDLYVKKPKFLSPPSDAFQKIDLIQFQFIDLVQKQPVQDVYIRVYDDQHNKLYSYRSNQDGLCKAFLQNKSINIQQQQVAKGKIKIEHEYYYPKQIDINENYQLSTTQLNLNYIIRKPQNGQIVILIENREPKFNDFYILQENRQIIQTNNHIKQSQNQADGIQYIEFNYSSSMKDILQLFACLPSLKQLETVKQLHVLTPYSDNTYKIPEMINENPHGPYFWMIGSLKEPYDQFDVVNEIINTPSLKNYPNLVKTQNQIATKCAFQSPVYLIATNKNQSLSIIDLDTYSEKQNIPNAFTDQVQQIVVWDEDNVAILDQTGQISWFRRDEINQKYQESAKLLLGKPSLSMVKANDSLVVGTSDSIAFISVRIDLRNVTLTLDDQLEATNKIFNMLTISNDQIVVLFENQLVVYKIEKSLDRPLNGTQIKQFPLQKGYQIRNNTILQIVTLDQRYLIFGGFEGILHTLNIDTLERTNNYSYSEEQTNTILQTDDVIIFTSGSNVSVFQAPETLQEIKTHVIRNFESPIPLYKGECVTYEKRLISFSANGQLLVWSLQNKEFPAISSFLNQTEFPRELRPKNESYILIEGKIPKENLYLYLITENGEIIKDSVEGLVKFVDNRAEGYFYMSINNQKQQGLWRIGAHMLNTELIKSSQPKIYYIYKNGYQIIQLPHQLPQSRKQIYNWFIGTMIPKQEQIKLVSLYTDQQIVGRFATLESTKHQGKINQLQQLNQDQYITAGEDKKVIIWDINTFQPIKVLMHEAEILTIFQFNGMIITGSKEGHIVFWKLQDSIWSQELKYKHHEKGVYGICHVDGSLVTSSEDRKMHLVNINTGALEHIESVDRTFVISVVQFAKDSFAAGFPDGRVKTYKREKTGPKIILKTLRTVVTVKVQHLLLQPQFQLFVAGMEKISDIINIDTGNKIRQLKEGHQGAVLCSIQHPRFVLTGGSDGRFVIWNVEKGISVKIQELMKEEIRGMILANRLLITASSNGAIRIWQEIQPLIDNIPQEEEIE